MESILSGIPGVVVYIDDVLVTGKSEEEHLSALEEVLRRIMKSGLRLRKDKCVFLAPSVVYLGHQIDSEGLHPVAEKVEAVQEAPAPKNVSLMSSLATNWLKNRTAILTLTYITIHSLWYYHDSSLDCHGYIVFLSYFVRGRVLSLATMPALDYPWMVANNMYYDYPWIVQGWPRLKTPWQSNSGIQCIHDHPWIVQGWHSSQAQDPLAKLLIASSPARVPG